MNSHRLTSAAAHAAARSHTAISTARAAARAELHRAPAVVHQPAAASTSAIARATGENDPLHLTGTTTSHAVASGGGILRTIVALLIVVALIYAISWVLKRVRKGGGRASGDGLAQVANLPLGQGRSLTLVRAGREVVLVGVAEHGVTPIRTYSETEAVEVGIPLRALEEAPAELRDRHERSAQLVDRLRRLTVRR